MKLVILATCLFVVCSQASAQITTADVTFVPTYTQTADNTTGMLTSTGIGFDAFTSGTTDFSAISVTTPSMDTVNLVQGADGTPRGWAASTTLTPVNGTYAFQATGASASSETIDITATGSFPMTPTLAGTSI
jgi:hypothetical protein